MQYVEDEINEAEFERRREQLVESIDSKNIPYEIIPEHRFETNSPHTYKYLEQFKERLSDWGTDGMNYQAWYALYRPREKVLFESPKLLTPDVCGRGEFTLDEEGKYYLPNSGYAIVPKNNEPEVRTYLLAVLNSSVTWFYIYQRSVLRGTTGGS